MCCSKHTHTTYLISATCIEYIDPPTLGPTPDLEEEEEEEFGELYSSLSLASSRYSSLEACRSPCCPSLYKTSHACDL